MLAIRSPIWRLVFGSLLLVLVRRLPGSSVAAENDSQAAKTAAELSSGKPPVSNEAPTSSDAQHTAAAGTATSPAAQSGATDLSASPRSSAAVPNWSSGTNQSDADPGATATTAVPINCDENASTLVFPKRKVRPPEHCRCSRLLSILPENTWIERNVTTDVQSRQFELSNGSVFWGRTCVTFRCSYGNWSMLFDIASDHGSGPGLELHHGPLPNTSMKITWQAAPPLLDDHNKSTSSRLLQYATQVKIHGQSESVCTVNVSACSEGGGSNSSLTMGGSCLTQFKVTNLTCPESEGICSNQCSSHSLLRNRISCSYVIEGLQPLTRYQVEFTDLAGRSNIGEHRTKDTVPEPVVKINIKPHNDSRGHVGRLAILSWEKPRSTNVELWYRIFRSNPGGSATELQTNFRNSILNVDVDFDKQYSFQIQACNSAGCSANQTTNQYTHMPGKPMRISLEQPQPYLIDVTSSTIQFKMAKLHKLFNTTAGEITSFKVVLAEGNSSMELSSPRKCCRGGSTHQYAEDHACILWNETMSDETMKLGPHFQYDFSKSCSDGHELLRPESDYCLFIIGYTSSNQSSSSDCFMVIHTKPASKLAAILVPVFVLLLLVAVAIAVLLLRRRQVLRFRLPWERSSRRRSHHDLELMRHKLPPKPVPLKEFAAHVEKMHEDSNLGFSQEFHDIKCISPKHPFDTAICAGNVGKNRYADIMPFDRSRVHLITNDEDEYDGSDYINANYVPGINSPREYIATQGPLPSTIADFWRMVWEQNVPTIVMLTSLVERGNTKCERYWPDRQQAEQLSKHSSNGDDDGDDGKVGATYGDIYVIPVDFKSFESYECTVLEIEQMSVKKRVNHFYYRLWPDMSCPHDKEVFIDFVEQVRRSHLPGSNRRNAAGPMLVHCSAGVGRTGTFIAVDVLLQRILTKPSIDVPGEVMNLREHRCRMVQTEDQYIFIHDCIACAIKIFESNSSELPPNGTSPRAAVAGSGHNGGSPRLTATDKQDDDGHQRYVAQPGGTVVAAANANMDVSSSVAAILGEQSASSDSECSSDKPSTPPEEEGPLLPVPPDLHQRISSSSSSSSWSDERC